MDCGRGLRVRGLADGKESMNWRRGSSTMEVILDRFVFRRDGVAKPFPEYNKTTARSSTFIGVPFRVCVNLTAPPDISRFYLEWPRGPKPEAGPKCHLVAAHRGCILFRLTSLVKSKTCPQYLLYPDDYFLYRPDAAADANVCGFSWSPPSLTRLPTWIRTESEEEKEADPVPKEEEKEAEKKCESDSSDSDSAAEMLPTKQMEWVEALLRKKHDEEMALGVDVEQEVVCSSLVIENVGLVCEGDDFVVAELQLDKSSDWVSAELSLFRSDGGSGGQWEELKRLPIDYRKRRDSTGMRCFWPQAVVTFGGTLCWVDYRQGMILGGVLEQNPKLSYIPFPPVTPSGHEGMHRGVCVTNGGSSLKFIDVVANKGPRNTNTFTIFTYTLKTTAEAGGRMRWEKDAVNPMTSAELWGLKAPAPVPHEVPLFPLVSMDKHQIVHFLLSECTDYIDTVTLVTVDMNARTVLSVRPYIKGEQELYGEDADVAEVRTSLLQPFLHAEFSKSLNLTRHRKRRIQG